MYNRRFHVKLVHLLKRTTPTAKFGNAQRLFSFYFFGAQGQGHMVRCCQHISPTKEKTKKNAPLLLLAVPQSLSRSEGAAHFFVIFILLWSTGRKNSSVTGGVVSDVIPQV